MAPKLLTTGEVAEWLGLSRWTVSRYVRDGVLPAFRIGPGKGVIRIDRAAVEAWLAKRSIVPGVATSDEDSADWTPKWPKESGSQ